MEVKKLLQKQRENLRFFWNEATSMEQSMASGEIVAAYSWNESYVKLKQQGVPVGFMVPKEGIFTWCCGLTLNSQIKNEDMAYDLINGMTSPETGAYEIATWGYGHSNKKAFDIVGPGEAGGTESLDTGSAAEQRHLLPAARAGYPHQVQQAPRRGEGRFVIAVTPLPLWGRGGRG